ncbi:hypothetical protein [Methylobacterium sp. 77]|uniref:phage head-tail joining protein n=1 Tax=Methylobacterium sp. 77 TaxID=1101192 RepID=UPI000374E466|nr:hypothetical protein [Methylobacterium sp. 77]
MANDLDKQIATLDRAMASGVLTVESPDTGRVTYRSYDEMRRVRADLVARRDAANGNPFGRRRTSQVVITCRSGW